MEEENQAGADASEGEAAPAAQEFERWALAKGHIPDGYKTGVAPVDQANPRRIRRGMVFRGDAHKGPHIKVIAQHMKWAQGMKVTEAQYDEAVKAAYSIESKES